MALEGERDSPAQGGQWSAVGREAALLPGNGEEKFQTAKNLGRDLLVSLSHLKTEERNWTQLKHLLELQ